LRSCKLPLRWGHESIDFYAEARREGSVGKSIFTKNRIGLSARKRYAKAANASAVSPSARPRRLRDVSYVASPDVLL
jgi:hypothetical protein